ncbi:ABC transporter permease [Listeria grayi]|uniref:ABC transporter permease n=1 Tax=Listeria grayi TaxID=1641 RepID=UPI0016261245|nr:ABC transporter permease [Listeria grayi]MBC1922438.1 ABC transporter permease [Listeria grayi]
MIWHILKKSVKLGMRDRSYVIYMLLFPLALMFVLGSALQNSFSENIKLDKLTIAYQADTKTQMGKAFATFAKKADSNRVAFRPMEAQAGERAVKNGKVTAVVKTDAKTLHVVTNNPDVVENSVLQNYLQAFTANYQVVNGVMRVDPSKIKLALQSAQVDENAITVHKLSSSKNVSSFQYYAIALIALSMMFNFYSGTYVMRGEKTRHTIGRIYTAPVKKQALIVGNFLGELVILALILAVLMIVSQFVFHVEWGNHILIVSLTYFTLGILAILLGMTVDMISNGNPVITGAGGMLIQVFAFMGGAYFPTNGAAMEKFSPLGWASNSVKQILYNHEPNAAMLPILLNLSIGIGLIILMTLWQNRKEVY